MNKPNGTPIWIDLGTDRLDDAREFYAELFGWEFHSQGDEFGGYNNITKDGKLVAGAMNSLMTENGPVEEAPYPNAWSVYLSTDNMEKTIRSVEEEGGSIMYPAMPVGPLGIMAHVIDPAGAAVGLWEPHEFPGFAFTGDPGTPVWFETLSKNYDATLPFYNKALGWDSAAMPDQGEDAPSGFRYSTNFAMDKASAGICEATFLADNEDSFWRVYFAVENTDTAIEKIKELGGQLLDGPEDSPFGRVATVTDNTGAKFQIVGK